MDEITLPRSRFVDVLQSRFSVSSFQKYKKTLLEEHAVIFDSKFPVSCFENIQKRYSERLGDRYRSPRARIISSPGERSLTVFKDI